MREWMLQGHAVQLPENRVVLTEALKSEARRYGQVFLEYHLAAPNRTIYDLKEPAQKKDVFKFLDPKTGQYARIKDRNEAQAICETNHLQGGPSALLPAARFRLMEVSKREYPVFLKVNGLENSPESYGLFMLGILHHFSNGLSSSAERMGLDARERAKLSTALRFHVPRPFNYHVQISPFSQRGAPEPTMSHITTSGLPFLDQLNACASTLVSMGLKPGSERADESTVERLETSAASFNRIREHYGLE